MSKLNDLLKQMGSEQIKIPTEPNPEQILQFKTNPLAVIMLHTELQSTLEERNYSEVFENDGEYLGYNSVMLKHNYCKEPEFTKSCELAQEIITYFREIITMKKIKGLDLSPYEENLSEFLKLSEHNQCKLKHLPLACKLPEFYQVDLDLLDLSEQLESIDAKVDEETQMYQIGITPLHIWQKHTKKEKKEITFLHFKTDNNTLVEYRVKKSDIIFELFNSKAFRKITLDAQMYGTLRSHPLSGFTYFVADQIDINS